MNNAGVDWKVLFYAFAACYLVPLWFAGFLVSTTVTHGVQIGESIGGWRAFALGLYWLSDQVILPAVAGYFTARYAQNRPQLHVLVVGLIVAVASAFPWKSGVMTQVLGGAVCVAMAS